MLTIDEIYKAIEANYQPRRKWDQGVKEAALDILESLDMPNAVLPEQFWLCHSLLLNGAPDWSRYSYGGCALVYNVSIAERFFTPSEMRRYMADGHDAGMAFCGESLLDMQTRALYQAERVILRYARRG